MGFIFSKTGGVEDVWAVIDSERPAPHPNTYSKIVDFLNITISTYLLLPYVVIHYRNIAPCSMQNRSTFRHIAVMFRKVALPKENSEMSALQSFP